MVRRVMKRTPTLLLALAAGCAAPDSRTEAPPILGGLVPPRTIGTRPTDIDVEHYALDLGVYPEERRIEGRCRVRLFGVADGLRTVTLDLEGLEVERVLDGSGEELSFLHDGGRLRIELATPVGRGRAVEVEVVYGGTPVKGLWFAGHPETTHLFTQGECEDARWWFPCQDDPADRATSELRVTMPAGWTSVAAGERIESRSSGGRRSELWRMHFPHPTYLVTLVCGELARVDSEWEGTPLAFLAPRDYVGRLEGSLDATASALAFLSRVTGKRYPYGKYSTACVEGFPFGGMENISATTLTVGALRDELGLVDGDADRLVVHEAAHQWFGDLLTCRDWSQIWLNEGFATYLTHLWFEETEGVDCFRLSIDDAIAGYLAGDDAQPRPLVHGVCRDPLDLFFSGHAYAGGASRLHLLRFLLGDTAFFAGLRRYVGENAGRGVTSEDLRRAMEVASGQDLSRFFEQWIRGPGHPELEVRWRWDGQRGRVLLTVNQTHTVAPGVPEAFEMPASVELRVAGESTLHRIEIEERRGLFSLPASERPEWVRFDKHRWLPARIKSAKQTAEWLAIAAGDDDVVGRRRAVRALAARARKLRGEARATLLRAIPARLDEDPSPGVRLAAAEVLGHLGGGRARGALGSAAGGDPDAGVRAAALGGLARFGPDPGLAELARRVYEERTSWGVMGAAAELLASSDPEGATSWVAEKLEGQRWTLDGQPHLHLLGVLARVEGSAAREPLREIAIDPAAPRPLRERAVMLLGELAGEEDPIRADLARLLKSTDPGLRRTVVNTLCQLGDEGSLRILAAYYPSCVAPRERRAIERVLEL